MFKKVTSYLTACKVLKRNPKNVPIVKHLPKDEQASTIAHFELMIIAEAINYLANGGKKWIADYSNYDQEKWVPRFYMDSNKKSVSGFSFGYADYGNVSSWSNTIVGGRLSYLSSDAATWAGIKFLKKYRCYMIK